METFDFFSLKLTSCEKLKLLYVLILFENQNQTLLT